MSDRRATEVGPARPATPVGVAVAVEVVVALVLRGAVLARPVAALDRIFVPDDTYYTLAIARSLGHLHGPTADGVVATSGFQPLIAFVMAPVYALVDDLELALRIDLTFLVLCDVVIVVLLAWLGRRLAGDLAGVVAAGLWAVSPAAVRLALGGLESTLAMVLELALIVCWLRASDRPTAARGAVLGAVAGLAVLARIDALALVGLVGVALLWRGPRRVLLPAAVAGAVVLAPWWVYCTVSFGSPFPASGSAARALQPGGAWSPLTLSAASTALVNGPFAVWSAVGRRFGEDRTTWPYWCALVLAGATAVVLGARAWVRERSARVGRRGAASGPAPVPPALVGAVLAAFAAVLVAFYGWFNVAYYVGRYLGPVVVLEALAIGVVVGTVVRSAVVAPLRRRLGARSGGAAPSRVGVRDRPRVAAGRRPAVVAAGATAALLALGALALVPPLWTASLEGAAGAQYEAATGYRPQARLTDRTVPDGMVIGAAQTGALAYYAGEDHEVVNLDGVVDQEAAEARLQGALGEYMVDRGVTWIADWSLNTAALSAEAEGADPSVDFEDVRTTREDGQPPFVIARRR